MCPEQNPGNKKDNILEVRMKNASVQSAVSVYRRIAKMVDAKVVEKAEILNITKSKRSIEQLLVSYFDDYFLPNTVNKIILDIIEYFVILKGAKATTLSKKAEVNEELEKIKTELPPSAREFLWSILKELRKVNNRHLQMEISTPGSVDPDGIVKKILLTGEDALIADALPVPVESSKTSFETEGQMTVGQFGYIREFINTRFGMQIALKFLLDLRKENLEDLTYREAEELINQLRNRTGR